MYLGFCIKCKNTFESSRLPKNAIRAESKVDGLPIYKGSCLRCSPYQNTCFAGYTLKMKSDNMNKAIYKKSINSALMSDTVNRQIFSEEITI